MFFASRKSIMKLVAASLFLVLLAGGADLAAQTVLQLPSQHIFATNSSILVPDQGTALLGGVNSASSGRSQFGGLPGNTSRGFARQAGGVTVSAKIHDFDAWDDALQAEAARRRKRGQSGSALATTPAGDSAPSASVAEIEQSKRAERPDPLREAEDFFARARQAQVDGKPRLARVYFQMAARRATGELKERALAEAAAVGAALASAQKTAGH
jgi:hypothetical protein